MEPKQEEKKLAIVDLKEPCPNCDDCCTAAKYCDGCDTTICAKCWAEHNQEAPCHLQEPEAHYA